MRARATRLTLLALLVGLFFASPAARAAPCGRPDVDSTFPPNEAVDVPPNAQLAAHYSSPADYTGEVVTLVGPAGDVLVDVAYDEAESMLRAIPASELAPGSYDITWPALRGVATNRGLGQSVEFSVGNRRDVEAPRFSGLKTIEWDLSREQDPCTDSLEDRFWFALGLGNATDDLDPSLLAVVVFETRGPSTGSAPEQIAVRPLPGKRELRVERPAVGNEKVCFAAVTRDLVNNVSGGGDEQVCVETTEPPFFYGCSLATRGAGGAAAGVLFGLAVALVAARRGGARRA